jgi:hypothetical protein
MYERDCVLSWLFEHALPAEAGHPTADKPVAFVPGDRRTIDVACADMPW